MAFVGGQWGRREQRPYMSGDSADISSPAALVQERSMSTLWCTAACRTNDSITGNAYISISTLRGSVSTGSPTGPTRALPAAAGCDARRGRANHVTYAKYTVEKHSGKSSDGTSTQRNHVTMTVLRSGTVAKSTTSRK